MKSMVDSDAGKELIVEAGLMKEDLVLSLYREADEILAMTVVSIKTASRA